MNSARLSDVRSWLIAMVAAVVIMVALSTGPLGDAVWESPGVAFVTIVVATVLCVIASAVVVVVGWRRQLAEVAIYGAALAGASLLPLVHGLTIPGVLYGPNNAVSVGAFAAVPFALAVAAPALSPHGPFSIAITRNWRTWTGGWLAVAVGASGLLLWNPNLLPAPTGGSTLSVLMAVASVVGTLALSLRQLMLYRIGRRSASVVAAIGFAYFGFSTLVWLGSAPYSPAWWVAHLADAAGVLGATAGLFLAHRNDRDVVATLAPVVNRDPLVALELGLTPVVHQFIAALEKKDAVTRDHVVRVAELAMRAGIRAGLSAHQLRTLGIAALLHDIGKLTTPMEVLAKPGALTDEEFELMKQHTVWGEELLAGSPLLAPAARYVRWHHERMDGRGYPDGLGGSAIPVEVTIISVCDAWDAMTFNRPYRDGMPTEKALVILREHAGTQWSTAAVECVVAELRATGWQPAVTFDRVGRSTARAATGDDHGDCDCLDALPAAARTLLGAGAPLPA